MANCGICESKVQAISQHPLQSSKLLEAQLNVIFILKHIYELRSDQLEPYIQKWGNPGNWLKLCGSCEDDVSNTRRVFEKLHEISREFEGKKRALKEKIKNVERERVVDKTRTRRKAGVKEALKKCRRSICRSRRTATPLILHNPFEVGDLKASELALKQELQVNVKEEVDDGASEANKLDLDEADANYHELTFYDENSCPPTPANDCEVKGASHDDDYHLNIELPENKPNLLPVRKSLRSRKKRKYSEEYSGDQEELLHSKARSEPERKETIVKEKMPTKKISAHRRIKCPVCMKLFDVKRRNSILTFSKHFQACLSTLAESSNLELKCSLCKKWSCGKADIREFMEHVALCRYGDRTERIPWQDAIMKCNICDGEHSLYLPFPLYIQHVFQYHQHSFGCSQCPFRARTSSNIARMHWTHRHKNQLSEVPYSERFIKDEKGKVIPLPYIPWWCPSPECLQEFGDEASRDEHLRTCQNRLQIPQRSQICSFCQREYFFEEELLLHRVTSHVYLTLTNAHKCHECGIVFKNTGLLRSHRRRRHGINLFNCDQCNKKFNDSSVMYTHIRLVHGHKSPEERKEFTCSHCGKVFGLKFMVRKHIIRVHENQRQPRPRPNCNRTVNRRSVIVKLRKKRKDIPDILQAPSTSFKYVCDWESCGKKFQSRQARWRHKKACHSRKSQGGNAAEEAQPPPKSKMICDICGAEFSPGALRDHIKNVHEKNFSVSCDICGERFPYESLMLLHKETVHEIQDFKRDMEGCSSAFHNGELLEEHTKIWHVGDSRPKKHFCRFCGKRFTKKSSLKFHEEASHTNKDSKPFKCDLCEKTFATKRYKTNHLKHAHKLPQGKIHPFPMGWNFGSL